jgi:hypothetical protein
MRGLDSAGSSWNDPAVFHNRDCRTTSLAMIAGHPGLAGGSYAQGGSLYYGRAGDSAGGIWPDGINEIVGGGYGGYCDLELVDGVPAICYYSFEGGDLWYVAAVDAEATAWNDPFIVASNGTVGEFCSMTVLGGDRPVIFYEDPGNFSLMAAYWQ